MATLHDSELGGRLLVVRSDKRASATEGGRRVFVGNLSFETTWQVLVGQSFFGTPHPEWAHGRIETAELRGTLGD